MPDIFISYGRADRSKAQSLVTHLERRGWSIWWDRELLAGDEYDRVIEENLDAARCVIVVWSKNSVDSNWVKAEAAAGLENRRLVPVRVDDVRLPLEFRRLQTIDFHSREHGDNPGRALTTAVAHILGEDGAGDDTSADLDTAAGALGGRRRLLFASGVVLLLAVALVTWAIQPDEPSPQSAETPPLTEDRDAPTTPAPRIAEPETPADSKNALQEEREARRIETLVAGIRADVDAGRIGSARTSLKTLQETSPLHEARIELELAVAELERTAVRATELTAELERAGTSQQIAEPLAAAGLMLEAGGALPQLVPLSQAVDEARRRDESLTRCAELGVQAASADLDTVFEQMLPEIQVMRARSNHAAVRTACTSAQEAVMERASRLLARPPRAQEDAAHYLDVLIRAQDALDDESIRIGLGALTESFCSELEGQLPRESVGDEARAEGLRTFAALPDLDPDSPPARLVESAVARFDWSAADAPAARERLGALVPLLAEYDSGELGRQLGQHLSDLRRVVTDADAAFVAAWRTAREEILRDGDLEAARTYYRSLIEQYESGSDMERLARIGIEDHDAQLALRTRDSRDRKMDDAKRLTLIKNAAEDLARLRIPDTLRTPDDESADAYILYRRATLHSEIARIYSQLVEFRPGSQNFHDDWVHHATKRIPAIRNELAADHPEERMHGGDRFSDMANALPTYRPRTR